MKRWGQRLVTLTKEFERNNFVGGEGDEAETEAQESAESLIPDSNKSRKQRVLKIQDLQVRHCKFQAVTQC